jgi:hypothetical protein
VDFQRELLFTQTSLENVDLYFLGEKEIGVQA